MQPAYLLGAGGLAPVDVQPVSTATANRKARVLVAVIVVIVIVEFIIRRIDDGDKEDKPVIPIDGHASLPLCGLLGGGSRT